MEGITKICVRDLDNDWFSFQPKLNSRINAMKQVKNDLTFLIDLRQNLSLFLAERDLLTKLVLVFCESNLEPVHTEIQKILVQLYPPHKTSTIKYETFKVNEKKEMVEVMAEKIFDNDKILCDEYLLENCAPLIPELVDVIGDENVAKNTQNRREERIFMDNPVNRSPFEPSDCNGEDDATKQIKKLISSSRCWKMSAENVSNIPDLHGIYAIYYVGPEEATKPVSLNGWWMSNCFHPIYVGQSSIGDSSIRKRLKEHFKNLSLVGDAFPSMFMFTFTPTNPKAAVYCEMTLIDEFNPLFNSSGNKKGMGFGERWKRCFVTHHDGISDLMANLTLGTPLPKEEEEEKQEAKKA